MENYSREKQRQWLPDAGVRPQWRPPDGSLSLRYCPAVRKCTAGPLSPTHINDNFPPTSWNNKQTIIWKRSGMQRHNNKAAMTFKRAEQSSRGRSNPCASGGALQDSGSSSSGERERRHPSVRTNKAPFSPSQLSLHSSLHPLLRLIGPPPSPPLLSGHLSVLFFRVLSMREK